MKRVITYGTFDLLHYGHINILKYIWYSETRTSYSFSNNLEEVNYRIGSKDQTDYYFYYLQRILQSLIKELLQNLLKIKPTKMEVI